VNVSNRAYSTIAEGRSQPRTVRKVGEPKKKKKQAKPRVDGDRDRRGTSTGGRPPNSGPSNDAALPSDVHRGHDCSTSAGHPPHLQPLSEAHKGKDAAQPSTGRIRFIVYAFFEHTMRDSS